MKVFISADIEGVTGTTVWDEVTKDHRDYPEFREQMVREVAAACQGALDAGATRILVKDAHETARNLAGADLPEPVELVRGWSRHPYMMMQELDASFDAAMMVGYHAMAGSDENPLAHTFCSEKIQWMTINGLPVSEFLLNTYTAAMEKVPVVMIAGDLGVCDHARKIIPGIQTAAVKKGNAASTVNLHPAVACRQIQAAAKKGLESAGRVQVPELPEFFEVELAFKDFKEAYRFGFYPGATFRAPDKIIFETHSYMDILTLLLFV